MIRMSLRRAVPIEPGIIPIFRLFAGVMTVLLMLGLCAWQSLMPPVRALNLAMTLCTALLCAYLALRPLQHWLRSRFLPVALIFATAYPILLQNIAERWFMGGIIIDPALVDPVRLYVWCIPPLLLISVQYGGRLMLFYVVLVTLLPLALAISANISPALLATHGTHAAGRIFFYGITGYIVTRLSVAQRRLRAELTDKNAQLVDYAATLERLTITRERNRLARDLHDTLAHTLSAINVQLKAIDAVWEHDPQAARIRLHATQELSRTGLQEARKALHALRSQTLDELGLMLSIVRVAEQAAQRAGLTLHCDLPPRLPELPPATEQAIYRITEEAINNVVRHACAEHLTVCISAVPLEVRITDDGIGFDPVQTYAGHYGLIGIHERAALVDAAVQITSDLNKGTTLTLTLNTP